MDSPRVSQTPHLKPNNSSLWRSAALPPPPVRISIIPLLAGRIQPSACSEMSRIVAAAWCVYFLLPSFCLRLFVRVAPRQPEVLALPPL